MILPLCIKIRNNIVEEELNHKERDHLLNKILHQYAEQNHRVIALTYRDIPVSDVNMNIEDIPEEFFIKDLTFLGFAAI